MLPAMVEPIASYAAFSIAYRVARLARILLQKCDTNYSIEQCCQSVRGYWVRSPPAAPDKSRLPFYSVSIAMLAACRIPTPTITSASLTRSIAACQGCHSLCVAYPKTPLTLLPLSLCKLQYPSDADIKIDIETVEKLIGGIIVQPLRSMPSMRTTCKQHDNINTVSGDA